MKRKVLAYRKALVLQSIWDIEDLSDLSACWRAQDKHNEAAVRVMDALRAAGHSGLMLASSGCRLCTPCAQALGQPCKHPARRYSCLSAYCVYVKALADSCGMDYDCGTGRLGLFGLYAFD